MIEFKKKYSKALHPGFDDEFHVLQGAVNFFQEVLKIEENTSILLKKKTEIYSDVIGTTFFNTATDKISCHVYVHRHSTTLGTMICIAHEMVHAKQIDSNQCNRLDWEDHAEKLSIQMVEQYHIKQHPEKAESLCVGEVKLARAFVH